MRQADAFASDLVELRADRALTAFFIAAKPGDCVSVLAFRALGEAVSALAGRMVPVARRGGGNDSRIAGSWVGADAVVTHRLTVAPCQRSKNRRAV